MDLLLTANIEASLQGTQTIFSNSFLGEEIPSPGFSMTMMTSLEEASVQSLASKGKNRSIKSRKVEVAWECVWECLKMMMTSSVADLEEVSGAAACSSKCKWGEAVAGFQQCLQVLFLAEDQDLNQFQHKRIWRMEKKLRRQLKRQLTEAENQQLKLQNSQMMAEGTAQTILTCSQVLASKNNSKQSETERRKPQQKQACPKQIASIEKLFQVKHIRSLRIQIYIA